MSRLDAGRLNQIGDWTGFGAPEARLDGSQLPVVGVVADWRTMRLIWSVV
jgi:hypothetical protein